MIIRSRAIAILASFLCTIVASCSKDVASGSASPKPPFNSTGTVTGIDTGNATITIDHQDIPGFMSAMEMEFPAKDASLLNGFSVGDKVAFALERSGGKVTLVSMTKTEEGPDINGAEIFASNCAECHGNKGEGARKGIPLISGHALAHSEQEFVEQVTNGKVNKMPAFKEKLTDVQIAAVVEYVRDVIQKDVRKDGNTKHEH